MPPVVPRYDSAPVAPSGIGGVNYNTDAPLSNFGGGQAAQGANDAINNLSKDAIGLMQKEKQKADDTATKDAQTKFVQLSNDLMYHPENGVITKQGQDSFGIHDDYLSQFDKGSDEIERTMTPDQRRITGMMRQQYRADLDKDINRHVRGEAVKYETDTFKTLLDTNRNDAILHWQDPDRIQEAIGIQSKAIYSHAQANGLGKEWADHAALESSSKTHSGVIDAMLSKSQDQAAKKYYDQNIDQIDGDTRNEIGKKIEDGALKGNAQRAADQILLKSKSYSEAIEETKKIQSLDLKEETQKRILHSYDLKNAALRADQSETMMKFTNLAEKSVDLNEIQTTPGFNTLDLNDRKAIEERIRSNINGDSKETDRDTYAELYHLSSFDRKKFMELNLNGPQYKFKLNTADYKKFVELQNGYRSGDTGKIDGWRSDQDVINGIISNAGLDPKAKPGSDEGDRVEALRSKIDKEVIKEKERGKSINNDDIRRIGEFQTVQAITEKNWIFPDTKKFLYELDDNDKVIKEIVVPESDNLRIREGYKKKFGRPPTKEEIQSYYLRKLKRGR